MPMGVPISVPTTVIASEPAMAFTSPPALPGGGVIWVNSAGVQAEAPSHSRSDRIAASTNRPMPVATVDRPSTIRLRPRRLRYRAASNSAARLMASGPGPQLQPDQHEFGGRQHQEGDQEQHEAESDQGGLVGVADRLGELVGQSRGDGLAGR